MSNRLLLENGSYLLFENSDFVLLEQPFFDDIRLNILNAIDSAQAEPFGWDAIKASIPLTAVVRSSDTIVTITLPAIASYNVLANETLTVTVPAIAVVGNANIAADPNFIIDADPAFRQVVSAQAVKRAAIY